MNYKNILLLSDLDGTLLNSNSIVSEENQKAIEYFIENEGRFGIATGRSHLNAKGFIENVRINMPSILYNGCALYDFATNSFLALNLLPKLLLIEYLHYCLKEFENVIIQVYLTEMCHVISPEDLADPEVIAIHQPCVFCKIEDIIEEPWIKILFSGKAEELKKVERKLSAFKLLEEINWVYTSDTYLELLPAHITKGSMLSQLREMMGSDYKIYAVGDFYNDMEMLEAADVGIATSNALPGLKEIADLITVSNDESAIADIIHHLMKDN